MYHSGLDLSFAGSQGEYPLYVALPPSRPRVGIPNFVSGPREYIMEGDYVILAMCSWFRIS